MNPKVMAISLLFRLVVHAGAHKKTVRGRKSSEGKEDSIAELKKKKKKKTENISSPPIALGEVKAQKAASAGRKRIDVDRSSNETGGEQEK